MLSMRLMVHLTSKKQNTHYLFKSFAFDPLTTFGCQGIFVYLSPVFLEAKASSPYDGVPMTRGVFQCEIWVLKL